MKVLAIDTSTFISSVAILDEDNLYSEINIDSKKTNHSERLMLLIDEGLKSAKLKIEDIDIFSCNIGPGSFTGLRIAIATIKGLAQSLEKDVAGTSTLESLAYNIPFAEGVICPIMDAQRDQVYTCLYKWESDKLTKLSEESVSSVTGLIDMLKKRDENIILLGDGLRKIPDDFLIRGNIFKAPVTYRMPKASSVGVLTLKLAQSGVITKLSELEPNYMRKSQAEVQLEEKQR